MQVVQLELPTTNDYTNVVVALFHKHRMPPDLSHIRLTKGISSSYDHLMLIDSSHAKLDS